MATKARKAETYRGARRNAARAEKMLRHWSLEAQKDRRLVVTSAATWKAIHNKKRPHQGARECARRRRQMGLE